MDTKLTKLSKIKNSKNSFTVVVFMIFALLSFMMIYRYHGVELKLKEKEVNPFESEEYAHDLFYSNYYLYFKSYQTEKNKLIKPGDLFLSSQTINSIIENVDVEYYSSKLDSKGVKEYFSEAFDETKNFIANSDGNIKYLSMNKDSGFELRNYNFEGINPKTDDFKGDEKYIRRFKNFIVIDYDSQGEGKIIYSHGIDKGVFSNYFLDVKANKEISETNTIYLDSENSFSYYKVEPIKNMRFIYAIPQNINNNFYTSWDTVSNYINKSERKSFDSVESMARIVILAIFFITLLIPFRLLSRFIGFKVVLNFPFELLITVMLILYNSLFSDEVAVKIVRETITGNLLKAILSYDVPVSISKQVVNFLNFAYWFLAFNFSFLGSVLVKKFLSTGIVNYLKRTSIIYKMAKAVLSLFSKWISNLISFDMKKRYTKLFFAGIVITILSSFFLAISYTEEPIYLLLVVALFSVIYIIYIKIVAKEIKDSRYDYEKLLGLTEEIASGNLDKDIGREYVGMYEEIKRQLYNIQIAYKKSVEEEVKSQKMKSDLISNISHDLKTPLTSIISYADLLKNTDSNEDKEKYIDTILKKSERLKILIDDMFEISKAQSGNIKLDLVDLDIVELMKQSVGELGDRLRVKNIDLKIKYPNKKIILNLDGEKTYRIFENLIVNISKYAMPNSRAYINVEDFESETKIEFRNISELEIDYTVEDIAERFKRGDKSRNTDGSGLGISIAEGYAQAQNGKLEIFLDGDLFKVVLTFKKDINSEFKKRKEEYLR